MIPLKDENPRETFPVFTILIIMINCGIFGYEMALSFESSTVLDAFIRKWGFVPAELNRAIGGSSLVTLFSSMFLHGGYLHLGGNMLFLWVFGDNVEDELGHVNFLAFYLLAGVAGTFAQFLFTPNSTVPLIGASGAIAGVLGSYMLLHPTAKVLTAVIFIFFIRLIYLPAWILLGFWLFLQLLQGTASIGMQASGGGVAWFAHIGGFVAGFIVSFFVQARKIAQHE
jgi:membrane associated rhomboid family serine protease